MEKKESFSQKLHRIFSGQFNLTEGNFFVTIPLYAIPMVLLSFLQMFYSSVDQLVVSNFGGGYTSMNAVGSNSALINLIIGLFVGISVGANVVIAKARGMNDKETARRTVQSSVIISLFSGVFLAIAAWFVAPALLELMQTPDLYIDKAIAYLRIYFLGMPFLMVFNFGSALLRGMGDSKRPLYVLLICGIVNIGLNFLFVMVFNLDVVGVAITTVIAEFLEALLILFFLSHNKESFAVFSWKDWTIYKKETKEILKNGIHAGIQSFVFSFSNIFIQAGVNGFSTADMPSDVAVAGNTASIQIEHYIWIAMNSFAVAVSSIISQNYGALKKENLKKVFWISIMYETIVGLSLGLISYLLRYQLIGLFISPEAFTDESGVFLANSFEKALEVGTMRITLVGLTYVLDGYMDVCSYYLRGLGHSKTPTINSVLFITLFRIVFITFFWRNIPEIHSLIFLWGCWPVSWILSILAYVPILPIYNKKAFAEIDNKLALRNA